MLTADFDFPLPSDLIAQKPSKYRDASRLMVLDRASFGLLHLSFKQICDLFRSGNVLVLNDTRVFPARLRGMNPKTGGKFELLLLEEVENNKWWAMLRPGKRASVGNEILLLNYSGERTSIIAKVLAVNDEGHRLLEFQGVVNILDSLNELGEVPLPPYIERSNTAEMEIDRERYQTVFARVAGSVAAPTAGLHFTQELLETIRSRGVKICFVTLHVGLGTFAPVKAENILEHKMHEERFEIPEATSHAVNEAKNKKQRVIAVGTTSLRVLESAARKTENGTNGLVAGAGRTNIFIYPPYDFKIVDGLVTNFHLPRSTLLMLVSAFAAPKRTDGRQKILAAYQEAVTQRYRFFSYGDAMFIQ